MSTRYLDIADLVIDKEFEELLPVLSAEESEKLENSILKHGLLDPIKIWQDPDTDKWIIIDGHNRYKILKKNNIKWNAWCDYKILYEKDLETRDDVKCWMLEQQLGRRNLSDAEKYEIVQRFKGLFTKQAKENQSSGGKGLTNLSKVNTRKEMAKATGVSEGTYQKLDKIMQSDNEDVKQQLREKKISVDKAYREIKDPVPKKQETITPQQQIEKLDNRMNEIDNSIKELTDERKQIVRRRSLIFEGLDIKCPLKYKWVVAEVLDLENVTPALWHCQIYLEYGENIDVLGDYSVYYDEYPSTFCRASHGRRLEDIPEKYKNDFIMIWKQAHEEIVKIQNDYNKRILETERKNERMLKNAQQLLSFDDEDKAILKKFYHVLATTFHPDSPTGDAEMMKCVNQLKEMWGI